MRRTMTFLAVLLGAATPLGYWWRRERAVRRTPTPRQRVERAIDEVEWLRGEGVAQGDGETPRAA